MSGTAIRVEGLSKRYRIGQREPYRALRDVLARSLTAPFRAGAAVFHRAQSNGNGTREENYIWALKDVSFEVKRGEVVGIIGRNGAGKSTLLKILSRITEPTEGYAEIHGRVGSLLEVGTGFHPELTGRENIYLNGAILGMKKHEIDRKFDEIVAFAEIEKFIDTPVKYYSSGMYVRLAFAVAAHLEPEILLVDEVLAVGDAAFQKKCLGKMGNVAKEGRTVLFVSHNMSAITKLCSETIWLDHAVIKQKGKACDVIHAYLSQEVTEEPIAEFRPKLEKDAFISKIEILDHNMKPNTNHLVDTPFYVRIRYTVNKPITKYRVGFRIRLPDGFDVLVSSSSDVEGELWSSNPGPHCTLVRVPEMLLSPGRYFLTVFIGQPGIKTIDRYENILAFQILGRAKGYSEPEHGIIATPLKWHLRNAAGEN